MKDLEIIEENVRLNVHNGCSTILPTKSAEENEINSITRNRGKIYPQVINLYH